MDLTQIKPNLKVYAKGGAVGSVDHLDGGFIKLNRKDSDDRLHHWIPVDWVERVDEKNIYLNHSVSEFKSQRRNSKPLM